MAAAERLRQLCGMDDEIGFHSRCALAEIDIARRAPDSRVARSHLTLAEQHLDRVRALAGREARPA